MAVMLLQAHSTSMTTSCGSIQASLGNIAEQGIKQMASTWQEELVHASERVSEFTLAHKDKLGQAEASVGRYMTEELKQDIPTGNNCININECLYECMSYHLGTTPQRRQFHYSSDLKRTRPHSDLLEEFRSTREAAMTLPQLPESDSELETSLDSASYAVMASVSILNNASSQHTCTIQELVHTV